jgi:hypothetical protein
MLSPRSGQQYPVAALHPPWAAHDACEIVLEGAERGTPKEEPVLPTQS